MSRFACLTIACLLACVPSGCARGTPKPTLPTGVIRLTLGYRVLGPGSRLPPPLWVQVGQPILVRAAPSLRPVAAVPAAVLGPAGWRAPDCSPARCYSLRARSDGVAEVAAGFKCEGAFATCVAARIHVIVEPRVCRARTVVVTPTGSRTVRSGGLSVLALSDREPGARPAHFLLARFFDTGNPTWAVDCPEIDWGDRPLPDQVAGSTVVLTGAGHGPYELTATHFYCQPGRYTIKVRLLNLPSELNPALASEAVGFVDLAHATAS
jgi:hypothetical protein